MADKYWWPSGGTGSSTGNWTSTTNWSTSSSSYIATTQPTSGDNANFGSYSGASAFSVTVGTSSVCANLVINNANMTLAGAPGTLLSIYGSVTVTSFAARTFTGNIIFAATTSVGLNFGSMTFTSTVFTFNGSGGTWTLGSALSTGSPITLFNGTLDTSSSGNYSLTASQITLGAGTKTLNLNASTVTLSSAASLSFATNAAGFTFNAGTSLINCTSTQPTFAGGGFTFYGVSFTSATITICAITGANTFNNLSFAGKSAVGVSIVTFNANQTINGTLTVSAPSVVGSSRYYLQSSTYGTAITLTGNTASVTDVDFRDITHSGTTWTGIRLGDAGGNSGITFDVAKTVYWNLAGSQSWTALGWATTQTGTPARANFPLPQDTAIFTDNNPVSGSTITLNVAYNLPAIDFSSRTLSLTFATGIIAPYAYGSITLSSAITLTGTGAITWGHRSGTKTITSSGRTWTQQIVFSNIGATTNFGDAFNSTNVLTFSYGTLTNTTYNITATNFVSNNSNIRTLNLGSGTWVLTAGGGLNAWNAATTTGLTLNCDTSSISLTGSTAKTFVGGGLTYYNLNQGGAGALTISGSNTFNNITNSIQPTTVTFTAASTNTFANFNLSGTAGNLITINSSAAGTAANIVKTGSKVNTVDYVSLQDSAASPASTWYAGANSTNLSNNTGWIFTIAPNYSNFFLLLG